METEGWVEKLLPDHSLWIVGELEGVDFKADPLKRHCFFNSLIMSASANC
jgi:hypothetical protein